MSSVVRPPQMMTMLLALVGVPPRMTLSQASGIFRQRSWWGTPCGSVGGKYSSTPGAVSDAMQSILLICWLSAWVRLLADKLLLASACQQCHLSKAAVPNLFASSKAGWQWPAARHHSTEQMASQNSVL